MALNEDQLSVLLQASLDKAHEMLEAQGGFYPFGTRVKPDGEIDFVQPVPQTEPADIQALYRETITTLALQAGDGQIIGAAVVANSDLPEGDESGLRDAIRVAIDTPGYRRTIYQPYSLVLEESPGKVGTIEAGEMFAVESGQAIFAG